MPSVFTAEAVARLLQEHFPALRAVSVLPDTPLFSTGLLDSFHLIDLIARLEKLAGTRIRPGEVSLENFDTPARIAALLNRKSEPPP